MSQTQLPRHRTAADRVIEAAWLLGLLLVPVLFTPRRSLAFVADPKYFALHLIAIVIVVAWVIEWATRRYASGYTGASGARRSVPGWAGRRPERWAVLAGVALGLIAIISTFLSPAPRVSLWGRSFVGLGYELYSFLALLIIFTAVAARLRHLDQAARILLVTMAAGGITSVYGISQNPG
ncbi:MAG: hypothetical protein IIB26_10675, partial [Chloroflexi bacterium]|nr:hypothetical protein [Chloroflexota bacterium]